MRTPAMAKMREALKLFVDEHGEAYTMQRFVDAIVADILTTHPGVTIRVDSVKTHPGTGPR
jgi:hypothetical protein